MPQVPQEQRKKLVQELLHIIKGKVLAISMKHDASRVVQTAIQFGSQQVNYAGMLLVTESVRYFGTADWNKASRLDHGDAKIMLITSLYRNYRAAFNQVFF